MVRNDTAPLTRIGFRRDVRLFLTALVGFLVVLIIVLLLLLQNILLSAEDVVHGQWDTIATAADQSLRTIPLDISQIETEMRLSNVRREFGIAAIWIERPHSTIKSGEPTQTSRSVQRLGAFGTTTYWFDATELQAMNQSFVRTAVISVAATVIVTILLLLYLPRIVRPVEEMLAHASEIAERTDDTDEARFVIETFKSSIATLKAQGAELKRLHEAEKSRADELQLVTAALTRSLTSGFVAFDAGGRLADINAAAHEILGTRDPGDSIDKFLPGSEFSSTVRRSFAQRETISRSEITHRAGTAESAIGLSTVSLFSAEQQFLGLLVLFADLTPIRRLETRVREMQNLADLGEIAGGIAHEFRNSLSTILGYLKLASRTADENERTAKLKKAEDEATQLATAVERLMAFARPMHIEAVDIDLLEFCREGAERLAGAAPDDVRVEVKGSPAVVKGDASLLSRMLENLLRNAFEAIEERGGAGAVSIEVASSPVPTLRIRDDGIGVAASDTARLFLPFQSDKPRGFGLGLSLAKKIALIHGGTITLEGKRGEGAVATVEFPQARS